MRRLARHLLTLCSAVSLLLCVASLGLWAHSYWLRDDVRFHHVDVHPGLARVVNVGWNSNRGGMAIGLGWSESYVTVGVPIVEGGDVVSESSTEPLVERKTEWNWARVLPRGYAEWNDDGPRRSFWNRIGFFCAPDWVRDRDGWIVDSLIVVPYWALTLTSIILPASRLWVRARRFRPGSCVRCGYDLRASPGRCPECGTVKAG